MKVNGSITEDTYMLFISDYSILVNNLSAVQFVQDLKICKTVQVLYKFYSCKECVCSTKIYAVVIKCIIIGLFLIHFSCCV